MFKGRVEQLSFTKTFLITFAIFAGILTIFAYNLVGVVVTTGSMEPTIHADMGNIFGLKSSYTSRKQPERGDIIIFKCPDDKETIYIKRIIGMPGEILTVSFDGIKINNEVLNEPYLYETMVEEKEISYIIPDGHYFVMGDNRNNSLDSRNWRQTFVPKSYIMAKATHYISADFPFIHEFDY